MIDTMRELAQRIRQRRESGAPPYTLFLGSTAWLVPGETTTRGTTLDRIQIPAQYLAGDSDAARTQAFFAYLSDMSFQERDEVLTRLLKSGAPSAGHRHMANLIVNGYFNVLVSSGLDASVEQSILNAGLWSRDLVMLCLSPEEYPERRPKEGTVQLVKLHGDPFAPYFWETWMELTCPSETRHFMAQALARDVIMVGYHPQDRLIDPMLERGDGLIVYVNSAKLGSDFALNSAIESRISMAVSGSYGTLDGFFGTLADHLIYRRDGAQQAEDDQEAKRKSLQNQLEALQDDHYKLQKQAAMYGKGTPPRVLNNQLQQSAEEIEALENQIAELSDEEG